VACLDQETYIGIHERDGHGYVFAVREHGATVSSSFFDEAEDIIPSKNNHMRRSSKNSTPLRLTVHS
jgi:hypothetical protein